MGDDDLTKLLQEILDELSGFRRQTIDGLHDAERKLGEAVVYLDRDDRGHLGLDRDHLRETVDRVDSLIVGIRERLGTADLIVTDDIPF